MDISAARANDKQPSITVMSTMGNQRSQRAINEANWQVSLSYSVQFELEDRSIHIYECCDTELDRHNPSGIEADVRIDPRMRFYMFCRCPTHFLSPLQRYTAL